MNIGRKRNYVLSSNTDDHLSVLSVEIRGKELVDSSQY